MQAADGHARPLRLNRDPCTGGGEKKQGEFLQQQFRRWHLRQRKSGARTASGSAERPMIEQEQDKWQRNDHGLGHEPGREQRRDQKIAPPVRFFRVPDIAADREEKEERAEQVLDRKSTR